MRVSKPHFVHTIENSATVTIVFNLQSTTSPPQCGQFFSLIISALPVVGVTANTFTTKSIKWHSFLTAPNIARPTLGRFFAFSAIAPASDMDGINNWLLIYKPWDVCFSPITHYRKFL